MKKSLLGLVAVAGTLLATSCSQDDLSLSGGEGRITFEVGVNNPMLTRAISDGSGANTLIYQVYQNGNAVGEQQTKTVASYPTTVEINNLEVNATYTVVFWAQNSACLAYNTTDLKAITVDYANAKNNDETRDAFYAALPVTVVGGSNAQQESVTLHRPFAQVNVGMQGDQLNGNTYTQSSMTLTGGVGNTFNALNGTASGNVEEVTFTLSPVVSETLSAGNSGANYEWLSMAYVLPGESNVVASFLFEGKPNNSTLEIPNVPLKTNYRTNILGNVQTGDVEIKVDQDPNFTGDNNLQGELQNGGVIVNNFSYSYENGTLKLSASYSGVQKEIESAYFILTPGTAPQALRTRAGDIRLEAKVDADTKTLTYEGTQELTAGQYYAITVEITDVDEEVTTLAPTGATAPGFTTPEDGGGEEPGGDTEEVKKVTIEEFLAAEVSATQVYQLTGTVTSITNNTYGNFDLKDDTGTVYVYGLSSDPQTSGASADKTFGTMDIIVGDIITINGYRAEYNGTAQVGSAWLIKVDQRPEVGDSEFTSASIFTCTKDDSGNGVYTLGASTFNGVAATGFKLGTGSKIGTFTSGEVGITGNATLTFYGVGWNGKAGTLNIEVEGGGSVNGTSSFTLAANSGANNNAPYTITVTDSDKYTVQLTDLTPESKIKFKTESSGYRAVVAGIKIAQ